MDEQNHELGVSLMADSDPKPPPAPLSPEPVDAAPFDPDAPPLLCPYCDYDLRGTPGNVCSECGKEFDRNDLSRSMIPWSRRELVGSLWAFFPTVWVMTFRFRKLTNETQHWPNRIDGGVFRMGVWLCLMLAAGVWLYELYARVGFDIDQMVARARGGFGWPDIVVLLANTGGGAMAWGIYCTVPLSVALFLLHLTDIPRRTLHKANRLEPAHNVLMDLNSGILVWLAPMIIVGWLMFRAYENVFYGDSMYMPAILVPPLLLGLFYIMAIASWASRLQDRGALAVPLALFHLAAGGVVYLVLLPFAVGYAARWIFIMWPLL